jgi:photosystem II stability/assembly factor-like uncharacterized protein
MAQSKAATSIGRWQAVGGREGGTVTSLAMSPDFAKDGIVFAGTLAGLHRSADGGRTWAGSGSGLRSPFVESVAVSPAFGADRTVVAGARNAGLWMSVDAGDSWFELQLWGNRLSVTSVAFSPEYASDSTMVVGTEGAGLLRSGNKGKTWTPVNFGVLDLTVVGLAFSPAFGTDQTVFAATPTGVYRSPNGGKAWRDSSEGLEGTAVQCIAISPEYGQDRLILVGTEEHGIYRANRRGDEWEPTNRGLTDQCVTSVAFSPNFAEDRALIAGTSSGIFVSRDAGRTWSAARGELAGVLAVCLGGNSVGIAGCANDGTFAAFGDLGIWEPTSAGLMARLLVQMTTSPSFAKDQTLFSASLDDGVARSVDGGKTWQSINQGLASSQVPAIAVSPDYARDRTVFAASSDGLYRSMDAGESWTRVGADLPEAEVRALALSPGYAKDGSLIAGIGGSGVFLSHDRGDTWKALPTAATTDELVWVGFSGDYTSDRIVYCGTYRPEADGQTPLLSVWRGEDDGTRWRHSFGRETGSRWLAVSLPPTADDNRKIYIAVDNQVFRLPLGFEFGTRTRGRQLWSTERVAGPTQALVALAYSPDFDADRTLYAAASDGVYRSTTGSLSWQKLVDGLAVRSVVALTIAPLENGYQVMVATLGGQVWRLA